MTHRLVIETTFEDGHTVSHFYTHSGSADDAHNALAKRWKAAGATFTRDAEALTLTRLYLDESRGGPYTDVITHEPMDGAA